MLKINLVTLEALHTHTHTHTHTIYLVNRIKEKYNKKIAINLLV